MQRGAAPLRRIEARGKQSAAARLPTAGRRRRQGHATLLGGRARARPGFSIATRGGGIGWINPLRTTTSNAPLHNAPAPIAARPAAVEIDSSVSTRRGPYRWAIAPPLGPSAISAK